MPASEDDWCLPLLPGEDGLQAEASDGGEERGGGEGNLMHGEQQDNDLVDLRDDLRALEDLEQAEEQALPPQPEYLDEEVSKYTSICAITRTHTHTHTHTRTHTQFIGTYTHAHTHTYTYARTSARAHTHTHTHTHRHPHHIHTRAHVHTHIHQRTYTHIHQRIYTHIHTHTHTNKETCSTHIFY